MDLIAQRVRTFKHNLNPGKFLVVSYKKLHIKTESIQLPKIREKKNGARTTVVQDTVFLQHYALILIAGSESSGRFQEF